MYALFIAVSLVGAQLDGGHVEEVLPQTRIQSQRHYVTQPYQVQDRAPWIYEPGSYHHHGSGYLDRYPTFRQRKYFRHYNYRNLMDYPWHEDLYPHAHGGHCGPTIYRLSTPLALPHGTLGE